MLEFYGDQDGARELLTNYAYDEKFPSNPNAHVYLYEFLKREKAPRAKLISVLKVETFPRFGFILMRWAVTRWKGWPHTRSTAWRGLGLSSWFSSLCLLSAGTGLGH